MLLRGGSYAEDVTLARSGAPGSPITLQANGSEAVTVRSFNVAASHVAIQNLTISGANAHCVTIQPAFSNVTIKGNHINDCGRDGIHFVRPGDPPSANYTSARAVVGNAISAVGRSDSEANDMTIYANYLTVQGNDMTDTPNDVMDAWGDHLTIAQNNIHDIKNTVGNHNDVFQTWTGLNDGSEGNPVDQPPVRAEPDRQRPRLRRAWVHGGGPRPPRLDGARQHLSEHRQHRHDPGHHRYRQQLPEP